jgi:pyruvate/2-oxoglutarate dehydrogenase complex dihydrolipoamide dehydrogenase (E3) component
MKRDVVIIGGGPAGVITALTARSVYPDKTVCLIKEIGDGVIPCAIPYMMDTIAEPSQNAMGNMPLDNAGVDIIVGKVESIDTGAKTVSMEDGDAHSYERLVLATGTDPVMPPIPGIDKEGVYTVRKSMSDMTVLREKLRECRSIVIIGGGFIGAEFADELATMDDTKVHLIEWMPNLLPGAFDEEFGHEVRLGLEKKGILIQTGTRVTSIQGDTQASAVTLDTGETIAADAVLVSIGASPAVAIADGTDLRVTEHGSFWVDDYLRTNVEGVFAVGDCAEKRDFFTRKPVPVWLASTATAEARVAGSNLFGIRVLRQIQGTIAAFSTQIAGIAYASAGMTCNSCEKEEFRYITATAQAPDRHPGVLPGAVPMKVKLIFADQSGILLGGQVSGGLSVGELINVIALAIQKRVTVRELDMLQIATHPLLGPAPTVHPLINAAHMALAKMAKTGQ